MEKNKVNVPYLNFEAQYNEISNEVLPLLEAVMKKGDFILGQEVLDFETAFANKVTAKHGISVANGTDALMLSLKALEIGPEDEVITVSNSWISTVSTIVMVGAKPVLVDIDEDMTIDPEKIKSAITAKTKAIIPVHLSGRMADMDTICEIAKENNLSIIEDSAQSVCARRGKSTAGVVNAPKSLSCFSLHPLKNLNAAGDAGIITTEDSDLTEKLKLLRGHGMVSRNEVDFWGYNSRMDTMQAVILNLKLKNIDSVIQRRRRNAHHYHSLLNKFVDIPKEHSASVDFHTYHTYVIQTQNREELLAHLLELGIEAKIHYPIPIHLQPVAKNLGYPKGSLPITETKSKKILSLPVQHFLTIEQIEFTAKTIVNFLNKNSLSSQKANSILSHDKSSKL